ncbi:MAG: CHRD domain-containing protein, partial [Planctomycetota bacterium]|nr:CHRD domain-containing protein [Planctomycetota bacterium]
MKTSTLRARSVLVAVFAASVCGQAFGAFEVFTTRMDGAQESPPVISNGIGWGTFVYDDVANTLRMQVDFSGLTGVTTVAHIHGATTLTPFVGNAGVIVQPPTLLNFPVGVSGGSY